MTKALRFLAALLVALPVFAQAQRSYTQPELEQMLAPVALYPDPLLSQLLMAATHPVEVIEAARWSRANPGLQGDDAVRAVQDEDWDPSVKSLTAFPRLLARLDGNLDWTRRLGEAFLAQEPQVMDAVQQLRRKAQTAGNLQSNEQIHVQQQGQAIVVQPASPQFVHVPYYDPFMVYGPWWWPAYQPVYWAPWPRPSGIRVSIGFFFGNFDWHHQHVRVVHRRAYYYRPPVLVNRTVVATPQRWQHVPRRQETRWQEPPRRVVVNPPPAPRSAPIAAQVRVLPPAQPQARMPAATAPQQPRAHGHEAPHTPRHAPRGEQRNERRHRGRERS
mgnify:CR=1 FL=1